MNYDITTLKSAFTTTNYVVGFKEPLETAYQSILSTVQKTSSSGFYFDDIHALCSVCNMKNIAPEGLSNSDMQTWIQRAVEGSIAKLLLRVYQIKKPQVKSILDNFVLYDRANSMVNYVPNVANTFVGYQIDLNKNNNLKIKIEKVGTQFDSVGTITLYLFHSSQKTAIASLSIATSNDDEKWSSMASTWVMTYVNTLGYGGTYYIGYVQGSIQAIDRSWSDSDTAKTSDYFTIKPICVENYTVTELPNIEDIEESAYTYGLNFKLLVESDLTQFMIDNKNMFAQAIAYQFAYDMVEANLYSHRNNEIKRFNKDTLTIELKGTDENKKIGLEYKLEKAIEELDFDLSALDTLLLPTREFFPFADL